MATIDIDVQAEVERARLRACERLLSLQDPSGWWKGELETNVTMDAEDLLLREFLGIRDRAATERSARWIRSRQHADGSWSQFRAARATSRRPLKPMWRCGWPATPRRRHMQAAAEFARALGGSQQTRVFTHIWLALFGAWPWEQVPALPPEMMLLPAWAPLNPYDFACWARQTIVALSVVLSYRPQRPLPFALPELDGPQAWSPPVGTTAAGRALVALDRVLHVYQRRPQRRLRELSLARAERWIVDRQEADGSWGGIQPPWVYSLIALHLRGYPLDHPVMRRGFDGLDAFTIEERRVRRLEACQSPVWDTALAVIALADAGVPRGDPAMVRATNWLLDQQILARGDWAIKRPRLDPGGWAFEFENANYPDIDDTAEVALALHRVGHPGGDAPARDRARRPVGRRDAELGRRMGRVRRRQLPRDRARPAVLRLRRGDRPSERGRDRACDRTAGGARPAEPGGVDWLLAAQEHGRLVVRPLGRQPRVRHRRRCPGADRRRDPTGR